MNHLNNLMICEIKIEKSSSKRTRTNGIDWSFEVYNHREPYVHLRACIDEPITLEPGVSFHSQQVFIPN